MKRFNKSNYHSLCTHLTAIDTDLQHIITKYGYPPLWVRPNTFATLVLTVLEQQVSLASAYAAFKKLREKIGVVLPEAILQLSDAELRQCFFSRQKIIYVRGLAAAITCKQISLQRFYYQPDEVVRYELTKLKGIGNWTADIYLLHALRRTDIFPTGDLALVKAIKEVKALAPDTTKEELVALSIPWKPYRSIATMILWHYYIQKRQLAIIF